MTQNWPFAKITDILQKKLRSVIVSQNHYLNKIIDVHPLGGVIIKGAPQPSECGRQRALNIVHAQTAAQQQSDGS